MTKPKFLANKDGEDYVVLSLEDFFQGTCCNCNPNAIKKDTKFSITKKTVKRRSLDFVARKRFTFLGKTGSRYDDMTAEAEKLGAQYIWDGKYIKNDKVEDISDSLNVEFYNVKS